MTHGRKASAWGLCALALVLIGCGAAHAAPRVGLYMNEATDVLNLKWDAAPANLAAQLNQLNLDVERDQSGQPGDVDAYVIPVQNGNSFYSAAEDMDAIAQYVEEGGLVVILDSLNGQEDALKTFVSSALNYEGDWTLCKLYGNNREASFGSPALSAQASSFVSGESSIEWPTKLEDAAITTAFTRCAHQDPSASIKPLYNILGDDMKTVVQAFGKVGVKGAIVWVGYSWREGVKDEWGALLNKLITDFSNGLYATPQFATGTSKPFDLQSVVEETGATLEHVVEAVSEAAHESAVVVKRMLQAGTYPPPPAPLPPSPVPAPTPSPFENVLLASFEQMPGQGSVGPSRDLVWNFDPDFYSELRDRRALQLVDPNKVNCTFRSATSCQNCLKAWKAWPPVGSSQKGAKPRPSNNNWGYDKSVVVIPLYFSDPVQLSDIYIKQIKAPGLRKVQLLSWPLDPLDEWFDINKYIRDTVYSSDDDSIPCQSELHITIPKSISGINLAVPGGYDKYNLPFKLKNKAVGGILLTVRKPKRALGSTWIETVKFDGRALYPSRDLYGPYAPAEEPAEEPKGGRRPRRRGGRKARM